MADSGLPMKASSRLAEKRRRQEELEGAKRNCHRPKATDFAWEQDCGILPSE